jgi:transcriptional regulator of acetoin/glycerol metabolism
VYNRIVLAPGALTGHDFTLVAQPVLEGYELEYAFVVCKEKWIRGEHLPGYLFHERPRRYHGERHKAEGPRGPGELEKILLALEQAQGKKAEAARRLGLSRVTLWKKMKKYNLVA